MSDTTARTHARAWLREHLTEGERPQKDWRRLLEGAWTHVLDTRVCDLVQVEDVHALTAYYLDADVVRELVHPWVMVTAQTIVAEMKDDRQPMGDLVPDAARDQLNRVLETPGLVHPDWIRALFRGAAAEAVLNDTLYRALRDFSTIVPRLILKASPMGRLGKIGGAGAFATKIVDEIERLLEPEIKAFLTTGVTQKALERAADFAVERIDDPSSIEFRHDIAAFILSKPPAFFVESASDALVRDVGEIAETISRHVVADEGVQERVRAFVDRVYETHQDRVVRELLDEVGVRRDPPIEAWANATWPAVRAVMLGPVSEAWLDEVVEGLLDAYERGAE